MNRNLITCLVVIVLLIAGNSCANEDGVPPYRNADLSVDERVEDLLGRMTPEEKFWQMIMLPGNDMTTPEDKEKFKNGIFGLAYEAAEAIDSAGVGGNLTAIATAARNNRVQKYFVEETRLGIPVIFYRVLS